MILLPVDKIVLPETEGEGGLLRFGRENCKGNLIQSKVSSQRGTSF